MLASLNQRRLLPILVDVALIFIAAFANAASVSWPFAVYFESGGTVWGLQIVALGTLCYLVRRCRTGRRAALYGMAFSTVWLSSTFWWLFVAMHTYAGLPAILAGAAVVALAAALSLYYAAACAGYWVLSQRSYLGSAVVFAALWAGAELARGTWLTGFGWGAIGYAHMDGPLAAYIPWLGAYGVGALAAWVACNLGQLTGLTKPKQVLATVAALVAVLVAPMWMPTSWQSWTESSGKLQVALLQGNIAQDEKFEAGSGVPQALRWYGEQLMQSRAALVVAPETAIPLLPQELPSGYWEAIRTHYTQSSQAALLGIPLGNFQEGYTNSVVGLSGDTEAVWRYDKHHLVPFGEFIPPMFKWFTRMMNIPLGDFNRGSVGQASFSFQGQRLAPNVCYEDLFGEELGVRFADASTAPTIFVNLSNIGWFGNTVAIDQHLGISRMRALEFQRPFVRATNTGATVILDHQAKVVAALPRLVQGVLEGTVEGRTGRTPFAWWVSRAGLAPLWVMIVLTLVVAWRQKPAKTLQKE